MIHGGHLSAGCIAVGDEAAEDLFVLVTLVGIERIKVILSPVDFRSRALPKAMPAQPRWVRQLYASIRRELLKYPSEGTE